MGTIWFCDALSHGGEFGAIGDWLEVGRGGGNVNLSIQKMDADLKEIVDVCGVHKCRGLFEL
jgi:hypothetical protein